MNPQNYKTWNEVHPNQNPKPLIEWFQHFQLMKELHITKSELDEMDIDQVNWYICLLEITHEKEAKDQEALEAKIAQSRRR